MKIWKWTLEITDFQTIEMPQGAQVLTVQVQHDKPQLWALVDDRAIYERRTIEIRGTGHNVPDDPGKYISTFQVHNGDLVFHVFVVD